MRDAIHSAGSPTPAGPYSPALVWNDLVFISGQGPVDPATGRVEARDFSGQARRAFANADALLRAAGSGRECVLKVQLYLVDLANFELVNELYAEFFAGCVLPARTTIQAAALPGGIDIELDLIAHRSDA